MLKYAIIFFVLGIFFQPFLILAFLFLLGSIFTDVGKILYIIISAPFKIFGMFQEDDDEDAVYYKETIIEKNVSSRPEQLATLSDLYDKGHITEDEFVSEKAKILQSDTQIA